MMRSKRLVALGVAVAVPLLGIVVTAGPAAAKKVTPTGSINCALSQTISFNPPLVGNSVAGTAGYAYDRITISPAQISNCTGTTAPAGAVPQLGVGTKPMVIKWKGSKTGTTWYAGSCLQFHSVVWSKLKPRYNWTATGLKLKGSKVSNVTTVPGYADGGTEEGYIFSGTGTGSFAGPVSIADFFTAESTALLNTCASGGGGTISSLTTDPTTSYVSAG